MLRLRAERRRRQWTQQRLSALTGIAQSDLSAYENERRQAGVGQRERVARVFGMAEAELFTPENESAESHA